MNVLSYDYLISLAREYDIKIILIFAILTTKATTGMVETRQMAGRDI